jgi:hypothetical protein
LDKGEVLKDGKAAEVVPYYAELMNNYQEEGLKKIISYSEQIQDQKDNLAIKIINVRTTDSEDKPKDVFNSDEPITVDIDYETSGILFDPVFVIQIIRQDNTQCCYFNSKDAGFSVGTIESSGTLQLKLPKTALTQGVYIFKIEVWDHKMIYPYIAIKKGIFKIVSDLRHEYAESVFLLNADWSKK